MRVLIYKRTHNGDPDQHGWFGVNCCMGAIRSRRFDAVIGVGGVGCEARRHGIDHRINWIGIGAEQVGTGADGYPVIKFKKFRDFGVEGPMFQSHAPSLAKRMYSMNVRHVMNKLDDTERREVERILRLAKDYPSSQGRLPKKARKKCKSGQRCRA